MSQTGIGISLEKISRRFAGKAAVENLSLEIKPGELLAFLGPSGCGKTTTLRCIAGFEIPDAGTVRIGETDVTKVPAETRKVGMVFQNYALFPNLSVAGNVAFGLRVAKWSKEKLETRVEELLKIVGLTGYEKRGVQSLSGGQRQRVALARALAPEPRVLLLDEPLSALDAKIRVELRTELRRLQLELGITTVLVTHDQEEAMSMSDRVVVMNNGRIEQVGTPRDLYSTPATAFVAAFVGEMNTLEIASLGDEQFKYQNTSLKLPNIAPSCTRVGVRPENIRLTTDTTALNGTIELVTYLGATQQILVQIGSQMWIARVPNNQLLTRGQRVGLEIAPEAWLAL